ncbi:MAG: hypothetical protein FD181_124 [Prolixibacteraceae bacterium]|nr:MAG: hypothetical protein FD181_124 [Prolixibacteraceae bacterium]
MKFDGTAWVNVGPAGFTQARCDVISIDTDNGVPWVALKDVMQNSKITVMKFSGGSWLTIGTPGFNTGGMTNVIHLDIDNGTPFVAYRDYGANYKASVMKFDGNSWILLGQQGFSGGIYDSYSGLAVHSGVPHVAAWDSDGKATVYKFNGSAWNALGNRNFSTGQASYLNIKFSSTGTPFVVFKDAGISNKASLMKLDGSNWVQVGDAFSTGNATYTSLAFSADGSPYVAFRDEASMRRSTVMKYGTVTGLKEIARNEMIQIYPNPNNGLFTIKLPQMVDKNYVAEVINLTGQTVYRESLSNKSIHLVNLTGKPNGIYLVKIKRGTEIFQKKIIVR